MLYKFFLNGCVALGITNPQKHYLHFLNYIPAIFFIKRQQDTIRLMGIDFPNRVGIVLSENTSGDYFGSLAKLGFGFIEAGIVTPRNIQQLQNNGKNLNKGLGYLVAKLKAITSRSYVVGVNIASNDDTAAVRAVYDHIVCMRNLYLYVDYMVFSLKKSFLDTSIEYLDLYRYQLTRLKQEQKFLTRNHKKYVPIVIEIPLHLSHGILLEIIHEIVNNDIDGVTVQLNSNSMNLDPSHIKNQKKFIIKNIPTNIPIFFKGQSASFTNNKKTPSKNIRLLLLQNLPVFGGRAVRRLVNSICEQK